jgi:caffeoyl-CoA O-methyltransferase
MSRITDAKTERYLEKLLPERDPVLTEMEAYAKKHHVPIIGPSVGRMIYLLAQISGAKRIFEMGSAIGYSTIWLARAGGSAAEVYYTDGDPANALRARDYIRRAGVEKRVRILVGNALELIDGVSGKFDLIFIDVEKRSYPGALRKALPRLKGGGLLLADNVLWSGRVTGPAKDAATRGIQKFNEMIYRSEELLVGIIPLRDGVAVCRKR